MKGLLLISLCTLFLFLGVPRSAANMTQSGGNGNDEVYIVYMGAASSTNVLRNDHVVILNSVLRRYKHMNIIIYIHHYICKTFKVFSLSLSQLVVIVFCVNKLMRKLNFDVKE